MAGLPSPIRRLSSGLSTARALSPAVQIERRSVEYTAGAIGFDDNRAGGANRHVRRAHAVEHTEVSPHRSGRGGARDIAASAAVIADVRVVAFRLIPVAGHLCTVAAAGDRAV